MKSSSDPNPTNKTQKVSYYFHERKKYTHKKLQMLKLEFLPGGGSLQLNRFGLDGDVQVPKYEML